MSQHHNCPAALQCASQVHQDTLMNSRISEVYAAAWLIILVLLSKHSCSFLWSVTHVLNPTVCLLCLPLFLTPLLHYSTPLPYLFAFLCCLCRFPDRRGRTASPSRSHGRVSDCSVWGTWRRFEEVLCTYNYKRGHLYAQDQLTATPQVLYEVLCRNSHQITHSINYEMCNSVNVNRTFLQKRIGLLIY